MRRVLPKVTWSRGENCQASSVFRLLSPSSERLRYTGARRVSYWLVANRVQVRPSVAVRSPFGRE